MLGARAPALDVNPSERSRTGVIFMGRIRPLSNIPWVSLSNPSLATKYRFGYSSTIWREAAGALVIPALPTNAGPLPIQTITELPQWMRLASQVMGCV